MKEKFTETSKATNEKMEKNFKPLKSGYREINEGLAHLSGAMDRGKR